MFMPGRVRFLSRTCHNLVTHSTEVLLSSVPLECVAGGRCDRFLSESLLWGTISDGEMESLASTLLHTSGPPEYLFLCLRIAEVVMMWSWEICDPNQTTIGAGHVTVPQSGCWVTHARQWRNDIKSNCMISIHCVYKKCVYIQYIEHTLTTVHVLTCLVCYG